ncbi:hypothetical protein O7630_35620 [Micromonospora sp. WMMD718]|uniref:hypothetical protein n=1 Tax=Micromonospora sp. WMMD718 TaxID=3016098 RepID=UPI0024162A91|nr:hypothetical protein [Micromonospora sp. WMMD718]MDG4756245.1 hypothetical protein [Micromonospora sp. WMMD718]MDG4756280.1 hypothetical protein [Micromonospora sp. WMMD718]
MMLDASGPEEIRAAFTAAIATAGERVDEIGGIAGVLGDAADRYESLDMQASTVEHLRDAGRACGTAQAAVATATEQLRAALADFNSHDGQVADTVAEAGTLASKEILMGDGSTPSTTSTSTTRPETTTVDGPPAAVGDVLGYADGDTCHGTDQVPAAAGPATTLALMDYGDGGTSWDGGRYVAVGTSPHPWNPVTNLEQSDSGPAMGYAAPHLDPAEAETAAAHLDELADLAEAGHRPPTPTKWSRAAQRLEHLLAGDADLAGEKLRIVDDELPVTMKDLLTLLRDKQPTTAAATRRHVPATAIDQAGGDTGALWLDLVDHQGATRIAVAGVEGTEDPDDDFWQPYTAHHTPAQARELAGKLRAFAASARDSHDIEPGVLHLRGGRYLDWSMPGPDGGRSIEAGDGVDAVILDLTGEHLRHLREQLHYTLTADPRAQEFVSLDDAGYIDWSTPLPDGGRQLEMGVPGGQAVAIELTRAQMVALDEQLHTDLTGVGQPAGGPGPRP